MANVLCQEAVCTLMYIALGTSGHCLCNPSAIKILEEEAYWGAVKRIFLLPQGYMISLVDLWWYWREFSWIYGCRWECVMLQRGMLLLSMVLFPAVPNVKKL